MAGKAFDYIRVSTPGQAKEGESLNTQREAIEAYCKKEDLKAARAQGKQLAAGTGQE